MDFRQWCVAQSKSISSWAEPQTLPVARAAWVLGMAQVLPSCRSSRGAFQRTHQVRREGPDQEGLPAGERHCQHRGICLGGEQQHEDYDPKPGASRGEADRGNAVCRGLRGCGCRTSNPLEYFGATVEDTSVFSMRLSACGEPLAISGLRRPISSRYVWEPRVRHVRRRRCLPALSGTRRWSSGLRTAWTPMVRETCSCLVPPCISPASLSAQSPL